MSPSFAASFPPPLFVKNQFAVAISRKRPVQENDRFKKTTGRVKLVLDSCHAAHYTYGMIQTFADRETQSLFTDGKSKKLPPDLIKRAIRRLEYIHHARGLNDLRTPPSNRLHALSDNRKGQYSISINRQWRICFRFTEGDAYDVEVIDYH